MEINSNEIGVVGIGNPHIIYVQEKEKNRGNLLEWHVLPKCGEQIDNFLDVCEAKEENLKEKYFHFPKWLLLLDLLDHDFNSLNKYSFEKPINRLEQHFHAEDEKMMKLLRIKNLKIQKKKVLDNNKFCNNCWKGFLNYYVIDKRELILCLECGFNEKKITEVKYISN